MYSVYCRNLFCLCSSPVQDNDDDLRQRGEYLILAIVSFTFFSTCYCILDQSWNTAAPNMLIYILFMLLSKKERHLSSHLCGTWIERFILLPVIHHNSMIFLSSQMPNKMILIGPWSVKSFFINMDVFALKIWFLKAKFWSSTNLS